MDIMESLVIGGSDGAIILKWKISQFKLRGNITTENGISDLRFISLKRL